MSIPEINHTSPATSDFRMNRTQWPSDSQSALLDPSVTTSSPGLLMAFRLRVTAPDAVRLAKSLSEETTGRTDRAGLADRTCRLFTPSACKASLTLGREENGTVHATARSVGLPLPYFKNGFRPGLHEDLRSMFHIAVRVAAPISTVVTVKSGTCRPLHQGKSLSALFVP